MPSVGGASLDRATRGTRPARRARPRKGRRRRRRARASRRGRRRSKCAASWIRPFAGQPAAGRERRPAHEPGGPDVAEHPALVADRVGQPGLLEQLVELGAMLFGHLAAHAGDLLFDVRRVRARPGNGGTDGAAQRVRQLERVGVRDVEAVEEPVPDEVEIARTRPRRCRHRARAALRACAPGSSSESSSCCARGSCPIAAISAQLLAMRPPTRATCRASGRAARPAEAGPVADVREEVSRRDDRRRR